jgi:hypothetical protein
MSSGEEKLKPNGQSFQDFGGTSQYCIGSIKASVTYVWIPFFSSVIAILA